MRLDPFTVEVIRHGLSAAAEEESAAAEEESVAEEASDDEGALTR